MFNRFEKQKISYTQKKEVVQDDETLTNLGKRSLFVCVTNEVKIIFFN